MPVDDSTPQPGQVVLELGKSRVIYTGLNSRGGRNYDLSSIPFTDTDGKGAKK